MEDSPGSQQESGTTLSGSVTAPSYTASATAIVGSSNDLRQSRLRRWNKVESISIRNFKTIRETTVPVGDVTILVGPNSSGKSSVLQAIHWAARAASYIAPKNTKEMVSFDKIDYTPSSDPIKIAFRGELRSATNTSPIFVAFNHNASGNEEQSQSATVKIWAARNKGGITAHIEGGTAVTPYKQRDFFITAYIPGLAGLSERESILAQPLLRRQAASGDAGGVLRNVLFNLATKAPSEADASEGLARLKRVNNLVSEVHPNINISVNFDDREDYNISANYSDTILFGEYRSLETVATGVLQVIQIFAYLVLFRPKIMLIDEPDAHLHPDKQERLIEALEKAAKEFDTQVILTTHSPHIVRAASPNAKLVWMQDGMVKTEDDGAIRRLLGWGGLDKDILMFIEDEDDKPIRAILRQWPELNRRLAVCRCFGVDNLPRDKLLSGLLIDGNLKIKAIVHRDRDFMTDEETEMWKNLYTTKGVFPWITTGSDIEFYFCDPAYLSALYKIDLNQAIRWRAKAASLVTQAKVKFFEKRKVIVRLLWEHGGSPHSDDLWDEASPDARLGKRLHGQLKVVAKEYGHSEKLLDTFTIPPEFIVAPELKSLILRCLSS